MSQVGQPATAAVPGELRAPEPTAQRAGVAGSSSVTDIVSSINRYLQVGGAAQSSPILNVSA